MNINDYNFLYFDSNDNTHDNNVDSISHNDIVENDISKNNIYNNKYEKKLDLVDDIYDIYKNNIVSNKNIGHNQCNNFYIHIIKGNEKLNIYFPISLSSDNNNYIDEEYNNMNDEDGEWIKVKKKKRKKSIKSAKF